jgi:eukaryotic-like serine/threonine-protein kinase
VYALNANTGVLLWSYATPFGGIYSSPAVSNGVVYVSSFTVNTQTSLYALNARTGAKLWSWDAGAVFSSSPVVANGSMYVGADNGELYVFGLPGASAALASPADH